MKTVTLITALWFFGAVAIPAQAEKVCVRAYPKVNGGPCTVYPNSYALVEAFTAEEGEYAEPLCTRIYASGYCGAVKEYAWVKTVDGKTICTLNYQQPPVSDLCETTSDYYGYAVGAPAP